MTQVEDPAKRVQLLLKGVGEDTGKNLIPVLAKSTDELRAQGRQYRLSEGDLKAAAKANAAYSDATSALSAAWNQFVVGVAPAVQAWFEQVTAVAGPLGRVLANNGPAIAAFVGGLAAVVAGGVGLAAVGITIGGIVSGLSAIGPVAAFAWSVVAGGVGLILSPVGLIAAALAGLTYLFVTQTKTGKEWAAGIGGTLTGWATNVAAYFTETKATAITAWDGIVSAVQAGRLDLAFKVATAALNVEWQRALMEMRRLWDGLGDYLIDTWHNVTTELAKALVTAFQVGLPQAQSTVADWLIDFSLFVGKQFDTEEGYQQAVEGAERFKKELAQMAKESDAENKAAAAKFNAELEAENQRQQKQRDAARAKRGAEPVDQGPLAAARAAFNAAVAEAKQAAEPPLAGAWRFGEKWQKLMAGGGPKLSGEVRGLSVAGLGTDLRQFFGGGGVAEKQLAEQKKANELAVKVLEAIQGLDLIPRLR